MGKSRELLEELTNSIVTMNLDMGGKHTYALTFKSMKIITKIKAYLADAYSGHGPNCSARSGAPVCNCGAGNRRHG